MSSDTQSTLLAFFAPSKVSAAQKALFARNAQVYLKDEPGL